MQGPVKYILVDARGHPFAERLSRVLLRFAPKLRHDFPTLSRDDVDVAQMLEAAGERILAREIEAGEVDNLDGFTWATLRNLARSRLRLLCHRFRLESLNGPRGRSMLEILQAPSGTPKQIESRIFMREVAAWFTPDEAAVQNLLERGFKFKEIAAQRGCTVEAARAAHRRAVAKAKLILQAREPLPQRRTPQRGGQVRSVKAVTARTAGVKPDDDERKAG